MRKLIIFFVLLLVVGCRTSQPTTSSHSSTDSTRASVSRLDSLASLLAQKDSTYTRDSIYVYQRGDTVTKYVERIIYKYVERKSNDAKKTTLHDTLYITKTDTAYVQRTVEVQKPMSRLDSGFHAIGVLCSIAFLLWLIFLYLKRKF